MERVKFMGWITPYLEQALGITLWDNQLHYLAHGKFKDYSRRTGKTTACCIKLALSKGEPLDMRHPEYFMDEWDRGHRYSVIFKNRFLEIRSKLQAGGFPVRDIKN